MSLSAAQKAAQKNKKKKESGRFLQGVKTEMKKVIWPTRKELINYTV
ncbi:preprotein translocase subunit SecE, partial [Anaeroglobus sp. AF13-6AC]